MGDALEQARQRLLANDPDGALAILDRALTDDPDDPRLRVWTADACLYRARDYDKAAANLDRLDAAGTLPPDVAAHVRLLRSQLANATGSEPVRLEEPVPAALQDVSLRAQWLVQVVTGAAGPAAEPGAVVADLIAVADRVGEPAVRRRVLAHTLQRMRDAGVTAQAAERGSGSAEAWGEIGSMLIAVGQLDAAPIAFARAADLVEAAPDHDRDHLGALRLSQAFTHAWSNHAAQARQALEALPDGTTDPDIPAAADIVRSLVALAERDVPAARRFARRAAAGVGNDEWRLMLAQALVGARLPQDALDTIDKLGVGASQHLRRDIQTVSAQAFRQLGRSDDARELFAQLIQDEPDDLAAAAARYHLADLALAGGDPARALEVLRQPTTLQLSGPLAVAQQTLLLTARYLIEGPGTGVDDDAKRLGELIRGGTADEEDVLAATAIGWIAAAGCLVAVAEERALDAVEAAVAADPRVRNNGRWLQVAVSAHLARGQTDQAATLIDEQPLAVRDLPGIAMLRWLVDVHAGDLTAASKRLESLRVDPGDHAGAGEWVAAAVIDLARNPAAAVEHLDRAVELEPLMRQRQGFPMLYTVALLAAGRLADADAEVRRLDTTSDSWWVPCLRGMLATAGGDVQAASHFQQAWELADEQGGAAREQARWSAVQAAVIAAGRGAVDQARSALERQRADLADRPAHIAVKRLVLLSSGLVEWIDDKPQEALAYTRQLVQLDAPADLGPMSGRQVLAAELALHGGALLDAGSHQAAAGALERSVVLDPDTFGSRHDLARALVATGRASAAIEHATRAVELSATTRLRQRALLTRARARRGTGAAAGAAEDCQSVLATDDQNPAALAELGAAALDQGLYEQAVDAYRRAWDAGRITADVAVGYSAALLDDGAAREALTFLDAALPQLSSATPPPDRATRKAMERAKYYQAVALVRCGDVERARQRLEDVDMPEAATLRARLERGAHARPLAHWVDYWFGGPRSHTIVGVLLLMFVAAAPVLLTLHATGVVVVEPPWLAFGPAIVGGIALALPYIGEVEVAGAKVKLPGPAAGHAPAGTDAAAAHEMLDRVMQSVTAQMIGASAHMEALEGRSLGTTTTPARVWIAPVAPPSGTPTP